jgi:hypothetical protein
MLGAPVVCQPTSPFATVRTKVQVLNRMYLKLTAQKKPLSACANKPITIPFAMQATISWHKSFLIAYKDFFDIRQWMLINNIHSEQNFEHP